MDKIGTQYLHRTLNINVIDRRTKQSFKICQRTFVSRWKYILRRIQWIGKVLLKWIGVLRSYDFWISSNAARLLISIVIFVSFFLVSLVETGIENGNLFSRDFVCRMIFFILESGYWSLILNSKTARNTCRIYYFISPVL